MCCVLSSLYLFVQAMEALNQVEMCGSKIDVSLAKPPSDKKKKEEILRNREKRMMGMMGHRGGYVLHLLFNGRTVTCF